MAAGHLRIYWSNQPSASAIQASLHLSRARISFFVFLIPCIFLMPEIFRQDLGLSNYGVSWVTIVPYTLGFLTSAYFTVRAALALSRASRVRRVFRYGLLTVAALQIALLALPDVRLEALRHAHLVVGMTLFGAELALSLWMAAFTRAKTADFLLVGLQTLACISAYFSLGGKPPLEAPSQLVFQLCFISLSIQAAQRIER
jgi:hypothetical protein